MGYQIREILFHRILVDGCLQKYSALRLDLPDQVLPGGNDLGVRLPQLRETHIHAILDLGLLAEDLTFDLSDIPLVDVASGIEDEALFDG